MKGSAGKDKEVEEADSCEDTKWPTVCIIER